MPASSDLVRVVEVVVPAGRESDSAKPSSFSSLNVAVAVVLVASDGKLLVSSWRAVSIRSVTVACFWKWDHQERSNRDFGGCAHRQLLPHKPMNIVSTQSAPLMMHMTPILHSV